MIPEQGWPGCPWGDTYNPSLHGFVSECDIRPTDNDAALKPAGLAKLAPAVILAQSWPGCPWGYDYDPMAHGDIWECMSRPADNSAASKTAGLAKLAPVEEFAHAGSVSYDPLAQALPACLSQPFPAVKAASKPAGLAAPAPAQEQFGFCGSSGESPDPLAWPQACLR